MKNKIGGILGILVLVGLIGLAIFFGYRMMGIGQEPHQLGKAESARDYKGKWITVNITTAFPAVCEIKHTMSYVIPTGKEYFFFAMTEDYQLLTIRAEKDWFEKNFNKDFTPKNKDGVKVKAYVRELNGDAEIICKKEAKSVAAAFNPTVYLDIHANRYGLYLILIGIIPLIAAAVIGLLVKLSVLETELSSTPAKVFFTVILIVFIGYAGLAVHTFAMI